MEYYLNFQINAQVLLSNGSDVATGAVVSLKSYPEAIGTNAKLPCDVRWWNTLASQTAGYDQVCACTDAVKRVETKLSTVYLDVTVPITDLTYTIIQGWAKTWLESIYGAGNVVILQ